LAANTALLSEYLLKKGYELSSSEVCIRGLATNSSAEAGVTVESEGTAGVALRYAQLLSISDLKLGISEN